MSDANLTVIPQSSGGNTGGGALVDLEFGSVADFKRRLTDMKAKYSFLQEFFREIMVKDEDFGTVPGTGKPTLYKPGAEKLCELYGFAAHVKNKQEEREFETGFYRVEFTLQLIHRTSGVVVGEGVGECSTFESKYRYRWVSEYKVPHHLAKEDLLFEEKDEWRDGQKTGNKYKQYRIPNEDMFSQWNTVLKMAYKRAYVGLTLQCTRSSGIFTQEESEMDDYADVPQADRKQGTKGRAASASSGRYQSGKPSAGQASQGAATQKNRVLGIMKQQELDWNGLAEEASTALGRPIKKVIQDIQSEADWKTVGDYLESGGGQNAIDFDDLPDGMG
ncbi:hypothetical protein [Paenibacillus sp. IHBB 10380]|uniref:hypothetical protein n=1 Tax=Paenibacillus sp. IHBB 10380 TaxID=1566358 RepID=UPI0006989F21|nr:hypothetical protein [Paenibacillus sp. IHBB 10380]